MMRELLRPFLDGLRDRARPKPDPMASKIEEAIASIESALADIRRERGLVDGG